MDYRSLVIVRNRRLTGQGKDVRRSEEEEWLWDALRLQKVASDMGEGGKRVKDFANFMRAGCEGKGGGVS